MPGLVHPFTFPLCSFCGSYFIRLSISLSLEGIMTGVPSESTWLIPVTIVLPDGAGVMVEGLKNTEATLQ